MRSILIAVHLAVLALGFMALAVLGGPLTSEGLVAVPSRVMASLRVIQRMPLDGPVLLGMVRAFAAVSALTIIIAFAADFPGLRPVRWLGAAVNAAVLVYLGYKFPALASVKKIPLYLAGLGLLYAGSAIGLAVLPPRPDAAFARRCAVLFFGVFWLATVSLLAYGAWRSNPQPAAFAVVVGCMVAHSLAFYCLAKAVSGSGAKSGSGMVLLLAPLAAAALFAVYSPPQALPPAAGLVLLLASVKR